MGNEKFELSYPHLCSPIKIGSLTVRNRMFSAPMTWPVLTPDGCLTPEGISFYELRARGGAGVVTVSEAAVHSATGRNYDKQICIDNPNVLTGLSTAARAIKRHGAIASINMTHAGMYALSDKLDAPNANNFLRYGPSACTLPNGVKIQEMSKDMMQMIVRAFADAAALCKRAGFDMVLIHGGHGWLLHQFFSPLTNHRTDEYGPQCYENRVRFMTDVLSAIRAAVGPDFPIELRMSAEENCPGGYTIEDSIHYAKAAEPYIDLLHISTGSHEGSFSKTDLPMYVPRGANVHYAAEIKKHVSVPVATIGALNDPEMMEEIIASGKADVVYMARALLADPYLPSKTMSNRADEIVHCCRCFTCMSERLTTGLRSCALNPVIGQEYEFAFEPALPRKKKRVLIAGGGPGGMEAAVTAARRGHDVTLCEKTGSLGGAIRCDQHIPFKSDLYDFIRVKALEMEQAGVKVRLNTPVTPELVRELSPDALIIAVGGEAVIPNIKGIGLPHVLHVEALPEDASSIGRHVVVLGGGLSGCEAGIALALAGKKVDIINRNAKLAKDCNARQRPILMEKLQETVSCHTGLEAVEITEQGVFCRDTEGKRVFFPADTVICALGRRPLTSVADSLRGTAPQVMELGDCVKTGLVRDAVFLGFHAGMDL